jgi:hypothetical protein
MCAGIDRGIDGGMEEVQILIGEWHSKGQFFTPVVRDRGGVVFCDILNKHNSHEYSTKFELILGIYRILRQYR